MAIRELSNEGSLKEYDTFHVIAWENVISYEPDPYRYDCPDILTSRSTPKVYTCSTPEEISKVLADCTAKGYNPINTFKSVKVTPKQTVSLDISE